MSSSSGNKSVSARRVWRLMFNLLMRTAPQRTKSLGRRGLTPNDARGLSSLDLHEGRTMRTLADDWECDASNVTWIVDRLEKMSLAERRTVPHDRRIKVVVLTPKGEKMRTELLNEFHAPPADLLQLHRAELETLQRLLEKLSQPAALTTLAGPKGKRG
jgi:DNA-binding MarR family transcriptional regulator